MVYKILEVVIVYNHPHNDYLVSVAIESQKGYWKGYYNSAKEISKKSIEEVARFGKKYSKHRALEVFNNCRLLEELKRHKNEN